VLLAAGRRYHPHLTVLHASRSTSPCSGAGRRAACGGEGCPHAIGPSLGKCSPCDRTGPQYLVYSPIVIGLVSFFCFWHKSYVAQKAKTRVASVKLSPSAVRVFCSPRRIASSRLRPRHFRRFALGTCRTSASAPRRTARPRARERPSAEAAVVPCQLTSV
jgi:hypothetical protein